MSEALSDEQVSELALVLGAVADNIETNATDEDDVQKAIYFRMLIAEARRQRAEIKASHKHIGDLCVRITELESENKRLRRWLEQGAVDAAGKPVSTEEN